MTSGRPVLSFAAVLILGLFLSLRAAIGAEWEWQHPLPQGNHLNGVSFVSPDHVFAVGDHGTFMTSGDGGVNWQYRPTNLTTDYADVDFLNSTTGTIVGAGGLVRRTVDGGDSWLTQSSGVSEDLHGVFFVNVDFGVAVGDGGTIIVTDDGGATWTAVYSGTWSDLADVSYVNSDIGFAVGAGGVVLKTSNGGMSWSLLSSGVTEDLNAVSAVSASTVFLAGDGGVLLMSDDGGQTWSDRSYSSWQLFGIHFTSPTHGAASGISGLLLTTEDGGLSWHRDSSTAYWSLHDIEFSAAGTGIAVGLGGSIMGSTDRVTWTHRTMETDYTLYSFRDVSFMDANRGAVAGGTNVILLTENGGTTWQSQSVSTGSGLRAIQRIDDECIVAVGSNGTIARTTDGGSSWQIQTTPTTRHLNGVCFKDRDHGVAVGEYGTILQTSNGGAYWYNRSIDTYGTLQSVDLNDDGVGYIVGSVGRVMKSMDNGWTWSYLPSFTTASLSSVSAPNSDVVFIAAYGGRIFRSIDAGASWMQVHYAWGHDMKGIDFANTLIGVAVGDDGIIVRTVDGGDTWSYGNGGTGNNLSAVCLISENTGTVVGYYGTILRTGDTDPVVADVQPDTWSPVPSQPIGIQATITDDGAVVSATLHHRERDGVVFGSWQSTGMAHEGGDVWSAVLPGFTCDRIDYYVTAVDDAGQTGTDPLDVPFEHHSLAIGFTSIYDLQYVEADSLSQASPLEGEIVNISAVVTAAMGTDPNNPGHFHVQEVERHPGRGSYAFGGVAVDVSRLGGSEVLRGDRVTIGGTVVETQYRDITTLVPLAAGAVEVLESGLTPPLAELVTTEILNDNKPVTVDGTGLRGEAWEGVWVKTGRVAVIDSMWGNRFAVSDLPIPVPGDSLFVSPGPDVTSLPPVGSFVRVEGFMSADYDRYVLVPIEDAGIQDAGYAATETTDVPVRPRIAGVAPNPFNPITRIEFVLSAESEVRLDVFDMRGRRIRTLVDGRLQGSRHVVAWKGRDDDGRILPGSVYLLRLVVDGEMVDIRKAVLVK